MNADKTDIKITIKQFYKITMLGRSKLYLTNIHVHVINNKCSATVWAIWGTRLNLNTIADNE